MNATNRPCRHDAEIISLNGKPQASAIQRDARAWRTRIIRLRCWFVFASVCLIAISGKSAVAQAQPTPRPGAQTVKRWDESGDTLPTGAIARLGTIRFRHQAEIDSLFCSPDRRFLVSSGGGTIRFWEPESGQQLRKFEIPRDEDPFTIQTHAAISPDGKRLFAAATFYTIPVHPDVYCFTGGFYVSAVLCEFDTANARLLRAEKSNKGWSYNSLAISPDGKQLVIGSSVPGKKKRIGRLSIRSAATLKSLTERDVDGEIVQEVCYSPTGNLLAVGTSNQVQLWNGNTLTRKWTPQSSITSLAFSPDEQHLAATCGTAGWLTPQVDGELHVWNNTSGARVFHHADKSAYFNSVIFSADGRRLAFSQPALDGVLSEVTVLAWPGGKKLRTIGKAGSRLARSLDNSSILAGDWYGRIQERSLTTGLRRHILPDFAWHSKIRFSARGDAIAEIIRLTDYSTETEREYDQVKIWSVDRKRIVKSVTLPAIAKAALESRATLLAVTEKGQVLQVDLISGTTKPLWQIKLGNAKRTLTERDLVLITPRYIGVVHDKNQAQSISSGISIYSRATGTIVARHRWNFELTEEAQVQLRGNRLAYATTEDENDCIRVFDVVKQSPITKLNLPAGGLRQFAISDDGRRVFVSKSYVSGQRSRVDSLGKTELVEVYTSRIVVRDIATGRKLLVIAKADNKRFQHAPEAIRLSPDGKRLAIGNAAGKLIVFDVDRGKEITAEDAHQREIDTVRFSADSRRIVTTSRDKTALVWDVGRLNQAAGR